MAGMSELKERLRTDLTAAIKAQDKVRSSTLRMVLTAVTTAEVAGKSSRELSDDDVLGVLISEGKKRREAAEAFDAGDRPEMAAKERAESEVLADYLPQQLSNEEVAALVAETISSVGAAEEGIRAMGKVMGALQGKVKGKADGSFVAAEVRRQLG
ncbi:MAG: glutamyl-tRNA amidotransferase [Marmoricola sp.]|nr:glutamyl-tRNA amidotransferase [Marmoricola sp.]